MARKLVVLLLLAVLPHAAHAVPLNGVDGFMSTVFQADQSSFSGLGVRLRFTPAQLDPAIELMPNIEYWRNSTEVTEFGISATRKDATLGFDARYAFPLSWKPYVGLGYGLHFVSTRVDAPTLGLEDASESSVRGGIAFLAGASFGLTGKISNIMELKYHYVSHNEQLKLSWGIGYALK